MTGVPWCQTLAPAMQTLAPAMQFHCASRVPSKLNIGVSDIEMALIAGREAARFAELLKAEGVTVTTRKYFVGEPLSLEMHFEAIEAMQVDDAAG